MNVAELFVRVRADVTDVNRRMKEIERSMGGVDRASKSAGLSTGRLGNQFAGLAGQIAHVHPVVGNLAGVLGNFAIGAGLTVGVLAGVAAIAVAYDLLTKSATEAKKAQDALIKSLREEIDLKALGPGGRTVSTTQAARDRADSLGKEIEKFRGMLAPDAMDADVLASNLVLQGKINRLIIDRQNALNDAAAGQSIVNERIKAAEPPLARIKTSVVQIKKVVEDLAFSWKDALMAVHAMDNTLEKMTLRDAVAALAPPAIDPNMDPRFANRGLRDFGTTVSGIDPLMGLTDEQKKSWQEINSNADKNTGLMTSALAQAAQAIGSSVAQALNIGGGGKGSSLGGALGGTAGFAIGFAMGGPIGGAIGSTFGSIAGSALGGLFDSNKKAVDTNTQAVRANTAALLQNSPSGYKTASGRFDATEVRNALQRHYTRGGAPILVTP